MATRNLRRNERIAYLGTIEVSWVETDGKKKVFKGNCTDVSDDGLRMELPVDIPVRTLVLLRFARLHLTGTATVRHVRRSKMNFVLGLQFNQQLGQQVASNLQALQPLSAPVAS
jgi:hypothetical protein